MPALLALPGVATQEAGAATPFAEAGIFFELNATAGDLGVHVSLDGESWRDLRIQDPRGRGIVALDPQGSARTIGLTELFFEGSEPSLAEVPFSRFLKLFPPGRYVFTGKTTGNQPLRSTDPLTAELPCPVKVVSPPVREPVAPDRVVIGWEPAPGLFNPDTKVCRKDRNVGLVGHEVIVEVVNEATGFVRHLSVELPAAATRVAVPRAFIEQGARLRGTEFKLEVIAIEDTGNKTITEGTFRVRGR